MNYADHVAAQDRIEKQIRRVLDASQDLDDPALSDNPDTFHERMADVPGILGRWTAANSRVLATRKGDQEREYAATDCIGISAEVIAVLLAAVGAVPALTRRVAESTAKEALEGYAY
jgi:hypothetical protein